MLIEGDARPARMQEIPIQYRKLHDNARSKNMPIISRVDGSEVLNEEELLLVDV